MCTPRQHVMKRASAICVVMAVILLAGLTGAASSSAEAGRTYAGRQLTVNETLKIAYDAGFRSERQLLVVTSIAIAESSLYTRARRWHPEYGYRPAGSELGVQGPSTVRDGDRQLHSDRGIFQISSRSWPDYSDAMTDDPARAARLVMAISKDGTDFTPWDAYKSGSAERHWDASYNGWPALRPLVRQFLADAIDSGTPTVEPTGMRHPVASGETLFRLAVRYYGNGKHWTRIADHNGIRDPGSLEVGQVVYIP